MVHSTTAYSLSYEQLKRLAQTVLASSFGSTNLALPERPSDSETDQAPYLDSAISMLSKSVQYIHNDRNYLDHRLDELDETVRPSLERLSILDKRGNDEFKYIQKQFENVDWRFDKAESKFEKLEANIKAQINRRFDEVRVDKVKIDKVEAKFKVEVDRRFDEFNRRFDEMRSLARNRLCTRLDSSIYKIPASIRGDDGQLRYEVHPDFPTTVRSFWRLKENSKSTYVKHICQCS